MNYSKLNKSSFISLLPGGGLQLGEKKVLGQQEQAAETGQYKYNIPPVTGLWDVLVNPKNLTGQKIKMTSRACLENSGGSIPVKPLGLELFETLDKHLEFWELAK